MPVVTPVVASPDVAATVSPAPPAPGFEAALRAAQAGLTPADVARLPSVSLGEMISALAEAPVAPAAAASDGLFGPPAAGSAPADAWGVAAAGPSGRVEGPGAAVLAAGERYLGVPYRWGGTDPTTGFDCSGFVQQVYADLGISLPRVSVDQARAGVAVPDLAHARPGDLVFWRGSGSRPNHIGIYAGDGQMLVAPRTGDVVRYQEITRTPDAVRRVLG